MNQAVPIGLLEVWNSYLLYSTYACGIAGIGLFLYYEIMLLSTRTYKRKYDLISIHQIHYFFNAATLLALSGLFYINTIANQWLWGWFLLRVVLSVAAFIGLWLLLQYYMKFHYPFLIEKRLTRLRYLPRTLPDGRKMKRLNEDERELYLDEGMKMELSLASVDYDVWVDEKTGFSQIEKYSGVGFAEECSECQYRTLRRMRTEVTKKATHKSSGQAIQHYKCQYCGCEKQEKTPVARLRDTKIDTTPPALP